MEFLRYPHLITTFFNRCVFGPPKPFTVPSTWTWIGHPVSGLLSLTLPPSSDLVSLRLHTLLVFNLASNCNSPDRSTKSTPSVRRPLTVCKHKVSGSLSLPSRGPFHLSFTVLCAIGHWGVFRLGGWSPRLPTGFLVSRSTLDTVG